MCDGIFYRRTVCKTLLCVGAAMSVNAVALQATAQQGITRPGDTPKWEAVSIKPCGRAASAGPRGRGAGPGTARIPIASPGRLNLTCTTVSRLIAQAYLSLPNGRRNVQITIDGGPAWINSDQYESNAVADGTPSQEIMKNTMLQAILEERFGLKSHRETREVSVYALTVLKGGIKLQALPEGSCDPRDSSKPPRPLRGTPDGLTEVLEPGQKPTCASVFVTAKGAADPSTTLYAKASNFTELAGALRIVLDRPVINRTGIAGMFDFRMQFAANPNAAGPAPNSFGAPASPATVADPAGPSIFTAIQDQLGLKLEATKGPGEFLVIDSVQRPTEN